MSEQTRSLDDLAKTLEGMGWTAADLLDEGTTLTGITVTKEDSDHYIRFTIDPAEVTLTGWIGGLPSIDVSPEMWQALDAIRAWQSPSPSGPSAADAVTLTLDRHQVEWVRLMVGTEMALTTQSHHAVSPETLAFFNTLEAALADGRS